MQPGANVTVMSVGGTAKVVIEFDQDEGSRDDVVLSKAWAVLAEKISDQKKSAEDQSGSSPTPASPDDAVPEHPGNATWFAG